MSRDLAQVDVKWQAETNALVPLLHVLAKKKINIAYLSIFSHDLPARASFCMANANVNNVKELIEHVPDLRGNTTIKAPIGSLTVFPHRSRLSLLGRLLIALTKSGCPVYGVASSISALTFNTDYYLVEHALKALEAILDLPPHHTPYRQEFLVRQI